LTKHIGIAAVSPEGAAYCYRQMSRHASAKLDPRDHPKISIHNEPLAGYIDAVRSQDWHAVGDLLRHSADLLASMGAELVLTPDHAVQHAVHLAGAGSRIPWIPMPELVADRVAADGRKIVGVIGTKLVTSGSTYQTHLGMRGIKVLGPKPDEAEKLDSIIFNELIYGKITPSSTLTFLGVVDSLMSRGCEGVVLASSEAPLVVNEGNSPLPTYDASDILAEGAIDRASAQ